MTETETRLAKLEAKMSALVTDRNEKVQAGQTMIDRANRQFDKAALPLARQINALRDQLEIEATPPPLSRQPKRYSDPDPDWAPEDIAHYHELMQR